jgi:hypothetical protein
VAAANLGSTLVTGAESLCVGGASGACVGVLQVQRGEQELELAFK